MLDIYIPEKVSFLQNMHLVLLLDHDMISITYQAHGWKLPHQVSRHTAEKLLHQEKFDIV